MTFVRPDVHPAKAPRPWTRIVLAAAAAIAVAMGLFIFPIIALVVGMSFDAPGADWSWYHVPIVGLPVLLLAFALAAVWAALSGKLKPLWITAALLLPDLVLVSSWLSLPSLLF